MGAIRFATLIPGFHAVEGQLAPYARRCFEVFKNKYSQRVEAGNFSALFKRGTADLILRGQQFAVQVINPRSFSAINDSFNHSIGDIVLKRMTDRIAEFYEERGIAVMIFNEGVNRVVIIPGLERGGSADLAEKLKGDLSSRDYSFCIAPGDIEDTASRKRFEQYVRQGKAWQNHDGTYTVNLRYVPLVKKDGTKVEKFAVNIGVFHFNPQSENKRAFSPADLQMAAAIELSELNRINPDHVLNLALEELLKDKKPEEYKVDPPSDKMLRAVSEFAENSKLQEMVFALPHELKTYLEGNKVTPNLAELARQWNADIYIDSKTGLYNRAAYEERLKALHAKGIKYVLARGDLNGFGSWNSLNRDMSVKGTEMGDELFKDFAQRFEAYFKERSISVRMYRIGGDELGFIFEGFISERDAAVHLQNFWDTLRDAELIKHNVNLYRLERFSQKYKRSVFGIGMSVGIHRAVDPKTMSVDPFLVDAEADLISASGKAKIDPDPFTLNIAFDRRTEIR